MVCWWNIKATVAVGGIYKKVSGYFFTISNIVLVYSGKSLVYSISIEETGIMKYNKHNETETLENIRKEVLKMGGFWDFIFGR